MRKCAPDIIIHNAERLSGKDVIDKINDWYAEIIRRKIITGNYTRAQTIRIIDGIILRIRNKQ